MGKKAAEELVEGIKGGPGSGYFGHTSHRRDEEDLRGGSDPASYAGVSKAERLGRQAVIGADRHQQYLLKNGVTFQTQHLYKNISEALARGQSDEAMHLITLAHQPASNYEFKIDPDDTRVAALRKVLPHQSRLANNYLQDEGVGGLVKPIDHVLAGASDPSVGVPKPIQGNNEFKDAMIGAGASLGLALGFNFFKQATAAKRLGEVVKGATAVEKVAAGAEATAASVGTAAIKGGALLKLFKYGAPLFFVSAGAIAAYAKLKQDPEWGAKIRRVEGSIGARLAPVASIWKSPRLTQDTRDKFVIQTGYNPDAVLDFYKANRSLDEGDVMAYHEKAKKGLDDFFVRAL